MMTDKKDHFMGDLFDKEVAKQDLQDMNLDKHDVAVEYTPKPLTNLVLDMRVMDEIGKIKSMPERIHRSAIMYAEAGFYLIPIVGGGKAIPPKKYGVDYSHASNSRAVIDDWFHPTTGKFKNNWNIGIATGKRGGVFVLDVDKEDKKGNNGFDSLEQILKDEKQVLLPAGPVQYTPGGGEHHLFHWQEGAKSTTGLYPAIDTRGGTSDACKGHIVVWPSKVDGKEYGWLNGGPLSLAPSWLINKLGGSTIVPFNGTAGAGRGNELVAPGDEEEQIPLEQIVRLLSSINPNDLEYDEWYKIGMAIKSQYSGDNGLNVWDEWSSHGTRYKPNECYKRWNSFNETGAVRMATLFYYAQQHGHIPQPTDRKPNKLFMTVERMNENHALVSVGNKIRIVVESEGEIDETSLPFSLLGRQDFRTLMENDVVCTDPIKGKYVSVADIWLSDPNRRTYKNGMGMYPHYSPAGVYNTWRGFSVRPVQGNCSLFKEHILQIICGGNVEYYNRVLDWCGFKLQFPHKLPGFALVMRGEEGTGKGTFANTLCDIVGVYHSVHLSNERHLTGNFNAHMANAIIVFADEITWGGNVKTEGALKALVTEKHLLLERKNIDAVSYHNMIGLLVASNSKWIVPAGRGSRRWLVLDIDDRYANTGSATPQEKKAYFSAIHNELDDGGREAFLQEMLERPVPEFLPEPPVTDALIDLRDRTDQTHLKHWMWGQIEHGTCDGYNTNGDPYWDKDVRFLDYKKWVNDNRSMIERSDKPAANKGVLITRMNEMLVEYGLPQISRTTIANPNPNGAPKRVEMWKLPSRIRMASIMSKAMGIKQGEMDDSFEDDTMEEWDLEAVDRGVIGDRQ